jgi:hypothetical protein
MPVIIVPAPPIIPPSASTSTDGYITATTDPTYGGVLLTADFSTLPTLPRKVRFSRGDGSLVRSGDTAWAPGGIAYAYDFEMELGVITPYAATPLFDTFGVWSEGTTSGYASVTVPDVDQSADFWLKSISNPLLSVRASSRNDAEFSLAGRDSLIDIPGSEFAAGSWDVPTRQPVTYTFGLTTTVERDALYDVLRAGPVLIQILKLYDIYDGYYVFAGLTERYTFGGYSQARTVTATFKPVRRPPTEGAPLYIPGRSYDDVDIAYASYTALDAAKSSYTSIIDP